MQRNSITVNPDKEREVDARIAESIFGLPTQFVKRGDGYLIPEDYYLVQERPDGSGKDFKKLPSYSTDMTDVWSVVERMIQDKWRFQLSYAPQGSGDWKASFVSAENLEGNAADPNFALAICLAASKAVEARQTNDAPETVHNPLAGAPP
jgi:hypothetical protein